MIILLFAVGFTALEATALFRDEARDPLRTIPRATWLADISRVGITTLLIATTVAVLAFFARRRKAGLLEVSTWRVFIAPGLGLVGLVIAFGLILQNLLALVGNSTPIAIGVVALLVASSPSAPASRRGGPK